MCRTETFVYRPFMGIVLAQLVNRMKFRNAVAVIVFVLASASVWAQEASIRIKVDASSQAEHTVAVCKNELRVLLIKDSGHNMKIRKSKYPEMDVMMAELDKKSGNWATEKQFKDSSVVVELNSKLDGELLLIIKRFGTGLGGEEEVDRILPKMVRVLRKYYEADLIVMKKDLGHIAI